MGFVELFPPQAAAVEAGLLEGKSLLVASPTASGKTLIAALAAYKRIVEEHRKVVYLSPLRALASEKYSEFRNLLERFGVRCVISTGDFDSAGDALKNYDLLVLTNEKFDSLLRHGIPWLPDVGLFISDEVHLAGSGDRGPTLEMILTKVIHSGIKAQLLSLSATVSNAEEIAKWLRSDLVELTWRPVPLREGVYDHGRVWFGDLQGEIETVRSTYGGAIDVAIDSISHGRAVADLRLDEEAGGQPGDEGVGAHLQAPERAGEAGLRGGGEEDPRVGGGDEPEQAPRRPGGQGRGIPSRGAAARAPQAGGGRIPREGRQAPREHARRLPRELTSPRGGW